MLYWSGELSRKKHEEMENHLKTCDNCREMLAELEALEKEFQALPLLTPDKDLLKAALEKHKTSAKMGWRLPVPVVQFTVAVTVVLALIFLYVLTNMPEQLFTPRVKTVIPLTSHFDRDLTHQMLNVNQKVSNVKERMRGSKPGRIRFWRSTKIHGKFFRVRSKLDELKARIDENAKNVKTVLRGLVDIRGSSVLAYRPFLVSLTKLLAPRKVVS